MPDSFVELVYADPPFGNQQQWRDREGRGFSDAWSWDEAAEVRLQEIRAMPPERFGHPEGAPLVADSVELAKRLAGPELASYLSWVALLLLECRRVMGSTEWVRPRSHPPEMRECLWSSVCAPLGRAASRGGLFGQKRLRRELKKPPEGGSCPYRLWGGVRAEAGSEDPS